MYIVRVIIRPAFLVRLGIHNVLLTELPTEANISKTWLVFLPRSILVFDKKKKGQLENQASGNLSLKDIIWRKYLFS